MVLPAIGVSNKQCWVQTVSAETETETKTVIHETENETETMSSETENETETVVFRISRDRDRDTELRDRDTIFGQCIPFLPIFNLNFDSKLLKLTRQN